MPDRHPSETTDPPTVLRIAGPGELLQAVPYLLGFHPSSSLILVGLCQGRLVVTARADLDGLVDHEPLSNTMQALRAGGSTEIVGAVYSECSPSRAEAGGRDSWLRELPYSDVARAVRAAADAAGCELIDIVLICADRWWSYTCAAPRCCPPEGRPVPSAPSPFTAAATYAGIVALPNRAALEALLDPSPDADGTGLAESIAANEHAAVQAVLDGHAARHERSVKRALFAAARASDAPGWSGGWDLSDADAARFGVALGEIRVRDAAWMALDCGRLDGRTLWRELARRLPGPYAAAPLFLFGWRSWRAGDGALGGIAAERAIASDPSYTAADLLLAALSRGVDPHRLPRLRLPRPA